MHESGVPPEEGTPGAPVVQIDKIGKKPVETGLAAIWGMAYSGDAAFPEGVLEASLDDEEWYEVTDRVPIGSSEWGARSGFHATLNTFLVENGRHRLRMRVKTSTGEVAASSEVEFSVSNAGRLAGITSRLLKAHPDARRTWVDLIDSSHFPYEQAGGVAWFDRADALDHVTQIVARARTGARVRGASAAVRA